MAKIIYIISLLSLLFFVVSYDNPSLVYIINEFQLKELEKVVIEKFLLYKELSIQDYHLKQKIDFIGTIQLDIVEQKFKFVELSSESMNIEFIENDKLAISIKDVKADLHFNYDFKSNFYSNKGTGTILFSRVIIKMKNQITEVKNKLEPEKMGPCFEIMSLDIESIDMDIKFDNEGQLEKIIKGIILNLKNAIVETIQKKFNSDYIYSVNDSLRESLANMKLSFQVAKYGLTISYSMDGLPTIQNKLLTCAFNAEIYDANYKYDEKPYPLPPIRDTLSSVDILFNQFILENYLYIMYQQNRLNWNIESTTGSFPLSVNTFQDCFPGIKEKYTDDEPIDLYIVQKANPEFVFTEKEPKGQTKFRLNCNIEFNVKKNEQKETAVAGDVILEIEFEFELKDGKISCIFLILAFKQFTQTQSLIGNIDPDVFIKGTEEISDLLLQNINDKLEDIFKELVIPSFMGIKFDRSNVFIHEKYLQIGISPYVENSWFALFK